MTGAGSLKLRESRSTLRDTISTALTWLGILCLMAFIVLIIVWAKS
jgi:ABC-type transport system involved in cytochrome c biogenesis permease subunit